jgi:hypothetical protein
MEALPFGRLDGGKSRTFRCSFCTLGVVVVDVYWVKCETSQSSPFKEIDVQ